MSHQSSFCTCDALCLPVGARHSHQKLIKNVSIFTGESQELITGYNVVLEGHKIHSLAPSGTDEVGYDSVIDGKGGFLTPGLIDIHWHIMLGPPLPTILNKSKTYTAAFAVADSKRVLMRGVTTVRDAAGDSFGIQQAIDDDIIQGPRIYPSGAMLAQYSGHGDFRNPNHLPREWGGPPSIVEELGITLLCNGQDQVLAAARHNLMMSATQIKLAVSGGVISFSDPLYVNEFFEEEIQTAVRAAEDFGTYVMVHCHNSEGAQRALKAGVKSFDHMSCADEETWKMLADAGAVASVQLLVADNVANDYPKGDPRRLKGQIALDGCRKALEYAKKYSVTLGWGTDLLDSAECRNQQLKDLTMRTDYGFSSSELMIQATGNGGKIVGMSGKRNPYGKVGVIEAGAMADILVYSKNPLKDIKIIEDHEANLKLIIKDGDIVKNTL